jgi:hypothetical protein
MGSILARHNPRYCTSVQPWDDFSNMVALLRLLLQSPETVLLETVSQ